MSITLHLWHRHEAPRTVVIESRATIGGRRATIHLASQGITETHAELSVADGLVVVGEHDHTLHGIFVNEVRITKPTPVGPDDVIRVVDWRVALRPGPYPLPSVVPRSDIEAALLARIAARPSDPAPRAVYADWLLESGHTREAELLQLDAEIAADAYARRRLGVALLRRAERVPFGFRAVVQRTRVAGCAETCPRTWDQLTPREGTLLVRGCPACGRDVELVTEMASAAARLAEGRPVVVDLATRFDPPPTALLEPLLGLSFFATRTPPPTVERVLESLGFPELPSLTLEPMKASFAVPGPGVVRSVFVRTSFRGPDFDWVPLHLNDIRERETLEVRLVLEADAREVDAWLRATYGEPRALGRHRVYGDHWTMRSSGPFVSVWWWSTPPSWTRPPEEQAITLGYLRELGALLAANADDAMVEAYGIVPPAGAGVVVRREGRPPGFSLGLSPPLPARDVMAAMGIRDAYAERDPHNTYLWDLAYRGKRPPYWCPYDNAKVVRAHVVGAPASARGADGYVSADKLPLDGSVFVDTLDFT